MKTKHTPEPWRYGRYNNGQSGQDGPIRIWDAKGNVVADVPVDRESDACLIAEAPAMLRIIRQLASPGINHAESIAMLARIDGADRPYDEKVEGGWVVNHAPKVTP